MKRMLLAASVIALSVSSAGAQEMCGGIQGLPCPDGQYCDYGRDQCGVADGAGVCKPRPEACTQEYAPVCGCDGQTYGNACQAAMAGATIDHDGECRHESKKPKKPKKPKKY